MRVSSMALTIRGTGCSRDIHYHFARIQRSASPTSRLAQNAAYRRAPDPQPAGYFCFRYADAMEFADLSLLQPGGQWTAEMFAMLPGFSQTRKGPLAQDLAFELRKDGQ